MITIYTAYKENNGDNKHTKHITIINNINCISRNNRCYILCIFLHGTKKSGPNYLKYAPFVVTCIKIKK